MCACVLSHFSHVRLFVTLGTIACQAPLSMGFSRPSCPPPGNLTDPGIKTMSLISPVLAGEFFTTSTTWKAHRLNKYAVWIIEQKVNVMCPKNADMMGLPGRSVVKNPPCNARDVGLIPGQGTKIPSTVGQLSPCTATTEPLIQSLHAQLESPCHNHWACESQRKTAWFNKDPACRN